MLAAGSEQEGTRWGLAQPQREAGAAALQCARSRVGAL